VCLNDFHGQASPTFILRGCPLPAFARAVQTFPEASQKMAAMTNLPREWNFLSSPSIGIARPRCSKAYVRYNRTPRTGASCPGQTAEIRELARQSGVGIEDEDGRVP